MISNRLTAGALFAIASLLLVAACTKQAAGPVATVNGTPITRDEFQAELRRTAGNVNEAGFDRQGLSALKATVLQQMIDRRLVLEQAAEFGLSVTEGEVENRLRRLAGDYPDGAFEETLQSHRIKLDEWQTSLRESMLLEKVFQEAVGKGLEPDDDELLRYYQRHAVEFSLPERIRLRHLVVATRDEAESLRTRVVRGESFAELARRHSSGPEAADGGLLGPISRGEVPQEFEVAFQLPLNELSAVVRSPYGYHLFRVEEKFEPGMRSFAEVRMLVRERLLRERKEAASAHWLRSLRDRASIHINQEVVDHVQ